LNLFVELDKIKLLDLARISNIFKLPTAQVKITKQLEDKTSARRIITFGTLLPQTQLNLKSNICYFKQVA
jgi:hypothetical protein